MTDIQEDNKDALSLTDEDEDDAEEDLQIPETAGTLSKWTNYIHGWQDRYIVLKEGSLSYYKSETETAFGCRGAISLGKAVVKCHEFDECRFDIGVNDCLWYLRARNEDERQHWIDAIEIHRQSESGYGSENSLRRHGSMHSLTSAASLSTASASSFKRGRGLREKLNEMETFRDILCRQVDTLQNYFDACSSALAHYQKSVHDVQDDDVGDPDAAGDDVTHKPSNHDFFNSNDADLSRDMVNILQQHGAHAIDFKGESFTFKATTAGILATLSHCIELMQQREDSWKRRLEREMDKRKRYEELYRNAMTEKPKHVVVGGPDYEEGPHCVIKEDEFFDAVDSALDKIEKEQERKLKVVAQQQASVQRPPLTSLDPAHKLYNEINEVVNDHIQHADMRSGEIAKTWQLIGEEGEMKIFRRELEEDGIVLDPLKAVHTIKGVTGHELCRHFWDPDVRMEWESTLDSTSVVEWMSKDTNISYQVYKRVWPATQRESLFWSTIRHCPSEDEEGPDYWIVANKSTEHHLAPSGTKMVRVRFSVAMICQTIVQPPENNQPITRDHLTCKIQYSANVNPGGWAPASVVRVISKRELPKFLKTFTNYVLDKTKDKPIMF